MVQRPQFLFIALASGACCMAQNALFIPDTVSGAVVDLAIMEGSHEFHDGEAVNTYGYNGDLLGPTIILEQGEAITLNVTNTLPDLTTTHWHGLHVSAANDGGPHSLIYPNTTWSPSFTVLDKASTYWYHPHGHGLTDYQVTLGLAGMIIVRDAEEAAMPLPRKYGVDDIPLILQAKAIVGGQVMVHTGLDSIIVVNGVRDAWKELPAQVVRLRCLNGSSERTFNLGLSNGMSFHVIGTDGGLLSAPVILDRLQLMPGERAELLVDLGAMQGQSFQLMAFNSELPNGIIGGPAVGDGSATLDGYLDNALNGADHPLCSFTVGAPTPNAITSIPGTLASLVPFIEADATITRTFDMQPVGTGSLELIEGPFDVNGALYDMDLINETVNLGTTEIWEFVNNTMVGHPVHIHDIQFNILDRNGLPVPAWEQGRKDVVYVPSMGSARVITRFDDFADPDMPYMYHCHLLMHEDEGMMGQFVVIDPNAIGEWNATDPVLSAWSDPALGGSIRLGLPGLNGQARVIVRDALGRTTTDLSARFDQGTCVFPAASLANGGYIVSVVPSGATNVFSAKLILHP